jgi:hypothetical protein
MPQPMNSINAIREAAKQGLDHVSGKTDAEVRVEHLEKVLEQAIETLLACAAVQGELEKRVESVIEANQDLFQAVLSHSAENARLRHRLEVAITPEINVQLEYIYKGHKTRDDRHLSRTKPSSPQRRRTSARVKSEQIKKD